MCPCNILCLFLCAWNQDVKVFSPDYVGTEDREAAVRDFKERIKHYESAYEPLDVEVDG